jgi:hypothetical protein
MVRTGFLAVIVGALSLSAACSDDEDPATMPTTTTPTTTVAAAESPDGSDCVATGERTVMVPDVSGERLHDAIRIVTDSGLKVIGDGVPDGDPTGPHAIVRVHEPPAGERVPPGACVGFRTEE